jgi:hypothetical protein
MELQKGDINKHYCNYCDIVSVSPYKLNLHKDTTKHKNLVIFAQSYEKLIDDIELIKYHNDNIKFIMDSTMANNININKLSSDRIFLNTSNNLKSCPACNTTFNNKTQIMDHIVKCSQKHANNVSEIINNLNQQDILRMYYLVDEYRKNMDKLTAKTNCTEQLNYQQLNQTYLNLLEKHKIGKTNLTSIKKKYNEENKIMNETRKQCEELKEKLISLREENAKLIAERDNAINNLNEFKRRYDTLDKEYKDFLTKQTDLTGKTEKSNNYSHCIGNQNNIKNKSTYKLVINNYSNAKDLETKISTSNPDSYLKLTKIMIEDDPDTAIDITKPACKGTDICAGSCELGRYCMTNRPIENNILDICKTPNNIDKYFVDIILKLYKPTDPKEQSIWNTDARRNNYLIKVSKDGESIWIVDKKGVKLVKIAIFPLIRYYYSLMDKHNDYLLDNILVVTKIMEQQENQVACAKVQESSTETETETNMLSNTSCHISDHKSGLESNIKNTINKKVENKGNSNEYKINTAKDWNQTSDDEDYESTDETDEVNKESSDNKNSISATKQQLYKIFHNSSVNDINSSIEDNDERKCNIEINKELLDYLESRESIDGAENHYSDIVNDEDIYDNDIYDEDSFDIISKIKIHDENIFVKDTNEIDELIVINIEDKTFKISRNKYKKLLDLDIQPLANVISSHVDNKAIIVKMLKRIKDKNYSNLLVHILSRHFRLTKDQATIKNE